MKSGTIDISDLVLPADDGALARAIADLGAKLTAWHALVARVQLRSTAGTRPEPGASRASPVVKVSVARSEKTARSADLPPSVKADAPERAAARIVLPEGIDENEILAGLDPDMAAAIQAQRRVHGNGKTLGELIVEYEKRQAEDEALLRTLEPEMAGAIRIQRRLCAYRKSVRELIREYRPQARPEPKSRTWWDKVKEGALHGRG